MIIPGDGNKIQGNYIGTDVTGTLDLGNTYDGVATAGNNTLVGGTTTAERNLISGNNYSGVHIWGSSGNLIQGNYIGTNATGTVAIRNSRHGILVEGAPTNTIGGITTTPGAPPGNVISGNSWQGIQINESATYKGANNNLIQGNLIGTNVTGSAALGNSYQGVSLLSGTFQVMTNTIGGTVSGARNIISGNGGGIQLSGTAVKDNLVQGNYIGTNITGTAAITNTGYGVYVGYNGNTVGGTDPGAGNAISGNSQDGVQIYGTGSSLVTVQGNKIGTQVDGISPLGNGRHGVYLYPTVRNVLIGGAAGNTIAHNGGDGVFLSSANITGTAIRSNSIFSNAGLGIDLNPDWMTANDAGDGDTGANNLQNFPVLTSATSGCTTIQGTLNSTPNTAFALEFFANATCDASGYGEGQTYLGSTDVTTDGSGDAAFDVTFSTTVPAGYYITATATDPGGNTSEFSQCIPVTAGLSCTWTGASSDWATADNWSDCGGGVPGSGDTAAIPNVANQPVIGAATDTNICGLTIQNGALVTVNGSLSFGTLNGDGSLTINGLLVVTGDAFTLGGTLTNNGEMRQTRTVTGSSDVTFLGTGGYGGVVLNAQGLDLGSTTVSIKGNQDCTTVSGESVKRCFDIAPANTTGRDATITFFFASSEIPGGQSCSNLNGYRWTGSGWQSLTLDTAYGTNGRSCGSDPQSIRVKNVSTFSKFVLKSSDPPSGGPTAVTLSSFTARAVGGASHADLSLLALLLLGGGLALHKLRRA